MPILVRARVLPIQPIRNWFLIFSVLSLIQTRSWGAGTSLISIIKQKYAQISRTMATADMEIDASFFIYVKLLSSTIGPTMFPRRFFKIWVKNYLLVAKNSMRKSIRNSWIYWPTMGYKFSPCILFTIQEKRANGRTIGDRFLMTEWTYRNQNTLDGTILNSSSTNTTSSESQDLGRCDSSFLK
jgi:hypothetical protein